MASGSELYKELDVINNRNLPTSRKNSAIQYCYANKVLTSTTAGVISVTLGQFMQPWAPSHLLWNLPTAVVTQDNANEVKGSRHWVFGIWLGCASLSNHCWPVWAWIFHINCETSLLKHLCSSLSETWNQTLVASISTELVIFCYVCL